MGTITSSSAITFDSIKNILYDYITTNVVLLILTIVFPIISLTISIFASSSLFAHDPSSINTLFDKHTNNVFKVNVNWYIVDCFAELIANLARLFFSIIGIY